jgi:hypothetical protein
MGAHEGDLTGADAFAAWAACSLDDCRDPDAGFDAKMLGELVTAAESFAVEVRSILRQGVESVFETMASDKSNDWSEELAILRAAIAGGDIQRTVAALDGTDDAAEWITPGHVLDAYEVAYLRRLVLP